MDLKTFFAKHKLKQIELSDAVGVDRSQVSLWMNGRRKIPVAKKRPMSEFMGISEAYLRRLETNTRKDRHATAK